MAAPSSQQLQRRAPAAGGASAATLAAMRITPALVPRRSAAAAAGAGAATAAAARAPAPAAAARGLLFAPEEEKGEEDGDVRRYRWRPWQPEIGSPCCECCRMVPFHDEEAEKALFNHLLDLESLKQFPRDLVNLLMGFVRTAPFTFCLARSFSPRRMRLSAEAVSNANCLAADSDEVFVGHRNVVGVFGLMDGRRRRVLQLAEALARLGHRTGDQLLSLAVSGALLVATCKAGAVVVRRSDGRLVRALCRTASRGVPIHYPPRHGARRRRRHHCHACVDNSNGEVFVSIDVAHINVYALADGRLLRSLRGNDVRHGPLEDDMYSSDTQLTGPMAVAGGKLFVVQGEQWLDEDMASGSLHVFDSATGRPLDEWHGPTDGMERECDRRYEDEYEGEEDCDCDPCCENREMERRFVSVTACGGKVAVTDGGRGDVLLFDASRRAGPSSLFGTERLLGQAGHVVWREPEEVMPSEPEHLEFAHGHMCAFTPGGELVVYDESHGLLVFA